MTVGAGFAARLHASFEGSRGDQIKDHAIADQGYSPLALIANGGVALTLYRFRSGDANMRSVRICSRDDPLGNFAVLLAAMGVFGTGTGWPDAIAVIMGGLGLWGGWQIVIQARGETAIHAVMVAG